MNDSGAPTDEKDMAHIYLDELQHLAAAGLAPPAPTPPWPTAPRARWSSPKARDSARTACRACPSTPAICAPAARGSAVPRIVRERGGAALIDAGSGLAFPACALAVEQAGLRAREHGVAFIGVANSHHFGEAGYHLEAMADLGLVGLALSNSPAAMPAWAASGRCSAPIPSPPSFPGAAARGW